MNNDNRAIKYSVPRYQNPVNGVDPLGLDWWDTTLITSQWVSGLGPDRINWGPNDKGFFGGSPSDEMKTSPGVVIAKGAYYKKNKGKTVSGGCPVNDTREALTNYPGYYDAGLALDSNASERFIGSYRVDIFPQSDGGISIVLTNTTSLTSYSDGEWRNWERQSFPYVLGNTRQVIWWTEPAPKGP